MEFYIPKKESTISYFPLIQTGYKSKFLPFKSTRAYTLHLLFMAYRVQNPLEPNPHPASSKLYVWEINTHQENVNNQALCEIGYRKSPKEAQDHRERMMVCVAVYLCEDLLSRLKGHAAVVTRIYVQLKLDLFPCWGRLHYWVAWGFIVPCLTAMTFSDYWLQRPV